MQQLHEQGSTMAKAKTKAQAKKRPKSKKAERIALYIKEKRRVVRGIDKALRPMFENLFDDLDKELTPLWPPNRTFFDIVGQTLARALTPGGARRWRPQAVKKAKGILKHYERQLGMKLVGHAWRPAALRHGGTYRATNFLFASPKLQTSLKRQWGEGHSFFVEAVVSESKPKLHSISIIGLDMLDVADMRIVKAAFDDYWALRGPTVSVFKIH